VRRAPAVPGRLVLAAANRGSRRRTLAGGAAALAGASRGTPRRALAVGAAAAGASRSAPRRAIGALAGGAAALALGACGTPSPDLFVVERDGSVPGAKLHMLVSDTSVRCNHGDPLPLTSEQTIEARDITDDLIEVQTGVVAYPKPPPAQIFHFKITDEKGTLRFPDTAQRPPVLPRTARFTRRLAIDACKLTR
jgi:hypothetical protein